MTPKWILFNKHTGLANADFLYGEDDLSGLARNFFFSWNPGKNPTKYDEDAIIEGLKSLSVGTLTPCTDGSKIVKVMVP